MQTKINLLSIVTVVKNDRPSLELTGKSISLFNFPHEWIVVDGGSDKETPEWVKKQNTMSIAYLREPDRNLYEAMNKGIRLAKGTHLIFINAGDRIIESKNVGKILDKLSLEEGVIGCIRRKDKFNDNLEYVVKPRKQASFYIKYGIAPTSHQATIYPRNYIINHPYDASAGIAADQISIYKLLKSRVVKMDDSLVLCDFKNGGIGETQHRGAFFKEMFYFRCKDVSSSMLILQIVLLLPVFCMKLGFIVRNRLRIPRFR